MLAIVFRSLLKLTALRCLNFTITGGSHAFPCSLCNTGPVDPAGKQCYKKCLVFLGLKEYNEMVDNKGFIANKCFIDSTRS